MAANAHSACPPPATVPRNCSSHPARPLVALLAKNYFGDLIRQTTGETATAIIRNFVMQKATTYLRDNKTITETSDLLGFEYPQHFTHTFKKHFGFTPSEFLKK